MQILKKELKRHLTLIINQMSIKDISLRFKKIQKFSQIQTFILLQFTTDHQMTPLLTQKTVMQPGEATLIMLP